MNVSSINTVSVNDTKMDNKRKRDNGIGYGIIVQVPERGTIQQRQGGAPPRRLGVVCHDVVYADDAGHGRVAPARAVRTLPIVVLDVGRGAAALSASPPHARPYCHSWASARFTRSALPFCQGR